MSTDPIEQDIEPNVDAKSGVEPDAKPDVKPDVEPGAKPDVQSDTVVQGPWGDDWREKAAGENEKAQNVLARYKSPQDFVKAHLALQQKMSSGEVTQALPENPSDEDMAAYRKAHNIPEAPEAYLDSLKSGLVVGEDDVPILKESMLPVAHQANMTPDQVSSMIEWYYSEQEKNQAALAEEDQRFVQESEDELRVEWGGEYRPNQNVIANFMETLPGDLKSEIAGARTTSGAPLMKHPEFQRWALNMASEINPAGTMVPSGGENATSSLQSRRTELEQMMRKDPKGYEKHGKAEYADVLSKLERLNAL